MVLPSSLTASRYLPLPINLASAAQMCTAAAQMCTAHRQAAGVVMEREQPSHLPLPGSNSARLGGDPQSLQRLLCKMRRRAPSNSYWSECANQIDLEH